MEVIKSVRDFEQFLQSNRDKLLASAVNASDITSDDEWMQENEWDEIYKKQERENGKV